jgi:FAD/FMN-containing dehydrogenase
VGWPVGGSVVGDLGGVSGAVDRLAARFSGRLLTPGGSGYAEARELFNGMIATRPALIAQCADAEDVAAALAVARGAELEVAVRAGGHSVAGMSSVEAGVVIDVRPLKEVSIDVAGRVARVGAGVTWGEFDAAAQVYGLATTGGRVSTTGVAGFTLGGGSGWIERRYGLACDSLLSVDVVLADGELVTASPDLHPDLFWALHGGGGNFGVATSFEFNLHPVGPTVLAGLLLWPAAAGQVVAETYRQVAEGAPDRFGSGLVMLHAPPEDFVPAHLHGQLVCAIAVCYDGPIPEGDALIAPLRSLRPEADLVGPMSYTDFQCMLDDPPGRRNYWGADYLADLTNDAITVFLASAADIRSPLAQTNLIPWGGAVARVTDADTPMTNRDAAWVFHPFAVWEQADDDEANIVWARASIADMRQFATGGIYLNFIGNEGTDRVRAAYGDNNYQRLSAIKAHYDPDNVFHRNQNIKPAPPVAARDYDTT